MLSIPEKTDLRVLRTRRMIMLALNELMNERGMDAITVQDIASRAMINRSTFYAHFSDKYDLLGFIIRDSFLDFLKGEIDDNPLASREEIAVLTTAVFDYIGNFNANCHKHPQEHCRPIIEAQVQSQLYELLLRWLQSPPAYPINVKLESLASMISWTIFGAGIQWNQENAQLEKKEVVADVTKMIEVALFQLAPK